MYCISCDELETQIATACDLLNTWAREISVKQCDDPYDNLNLRNLVDRIWVVTLEKHKKQLEENNKRNEKRVQQLKQLVESVADQQSMPDDSWEKEMAQI